MENEHWLDQAKRLAKKARPKNAEDNETVKIGEGECLLINGQYNDAIERLSVEMPHDKGDDFKIRVILSLGKAYLLAGRLAEARDLFDRLIREERHGGVSKHYIYAGLVRWFSRETRVAIQLWLQAIDLDSMGYRGADVPLILYYAAAREPDAFDIQKARELIKNTFPKLLEPSGPMAMGRLLLGEMSEDDFRESLTNFKGKNIEQRRIDSAPLIDYYLGVKRLSEGDSHAFDEQMRRCAAMRGYRYMEDEYVIARMEAARQQ